jgi:hypothetical protein
MPTVGNPARAGRALEPVNADPGAVPPIGRGPVVRPFRERAQIAEATGWMVTSIIVALLVAVFGWRVQMGRYVTRMPTGAESERRGQDPGETRRP